MAKLIDLKDLKTVSFFSFSADNKPIFKKLGEVNVEGLKEDGTLAKGTYKEGKDSFDIMGRAYRYKGDIYLTFSLVGGTDTFLGRLIFDQDKKLMVTGSLFSDDQSKFTERPRELRDQEETPIVITKP
jgi:hypothetical protein